MSTVIDPTTTLIIERTQCSCSGRSAGVARNRYASGAETDIVLIVIDIIVAIGSIDIIFCEIVHSGVGILISIVAGIAAILACNKNTAAQIAGIGEIVTLVEDGFFNLGSEFGNGAGREAAIVAVGEIIAVSPCGEIQVGDMIVVGRSTAGIESGYLLMVANKKQIGGSRELVGSIGVESFDKVGNLRVLSTHIGIASIGHGNDEALTLFPIDKVVESPTETAVCNNEIMKWSGVANGLGRGESAEQ